MIGEDAEDRRERELLEEIDRLRAELVRLTKLERRARTCLAVLAGERDE